MTTNTIKIISMSISRQYNVVTCVQKSTQEHAEACELVVVVYARWTK